MRADRESHGHADRSSIGGTDGGSIGGSIGGTDDEPVARREHQRHEIVRRRSSMVWDAMGAAAARWVEGLDPAPAIRGQRLVEVPPRAADAKTIHDALAQLGEQSLAEGGVGTGAGGGAGDLRASRSLAAFLDGRELAEELVQGAWHRINAVHPGGLAEEKECEQHLPRLRLLQAPLWR